MKKKVSYIGIIALIGAMLSVMAVFLNWITAEVVDIGMSGWELYMGIEEFSQYFFPLIVLVSGVIAVVLAALEILDMGNEITRIAMLITGVLIIAFSFYTYYAFTDDVGELAVAFDMGIGVFLEIIAGVILMITPAYAIVNTKKK